MASIAKKVSDRLVEGIKTFRPIVEAAKAKDINEADTVMLVRDILADVFGYDKTTEITSEFRVQNNRCDLATKIDEKVQTLIEVKAVGHTLKSPHIDQAVDYASRHTTCYWVFLTNGQFWRAYYVKNEKPIEPELVVELDFLTLNHKSEDHLSLLYLFCKEGWAKSAIDEYQTQKEALSRFFIGAIVLSEPVVAVIRKVLKRVSPGVRIHGDEIRAVLENDVIKREVLEGDAADSARKTVGRKTKAAEKESTARQP